MQASYSWKPYNTDLHLSLFSLCRPVNSTRGGKQDASESVDSFEQKLRQLFRKAYPSASQGNQEAEEMGKAVLATQFKARLQEDKKAKQAGIDGDIDQLLVNTWFEETKISDLSSRSTTSVLRRSVSIPECTSTQSRDTSAGGRQACYRAKDTCCGCGGTGHHIRQCAYNQMSQRRSKLPLLCQVQRHWREPSSVYISVVTG